MVLLKIQFIRCPQSSLKTKHEKLSYIRLKALKDIKKSLGVWNQIQMSLPQSLKYRFPDCDRNGHYPLFQKCIRELTFSIFSKESKQIQREDPAMVQEASSQTPLPNHRLVMLRGKEALVFWDASHDGVPSHQGLWSDILDTEMLGLWANWWYLKL